MRLQEIMSTPVVAIGPDETASAAWRRLEQKRIRHLLVTDRGRLLGVISERDLGGREGGAVRRGRTVRELMTAQVVSATPATTLRQAANLMRGRLIGALPVVEDGLIVGIVDRHRRAEELGRGSSVRPFRGRRQFMRLPPVTRSERRPARRSRKDRTAGRQVGPGSGPRARAPAPARQPQARSMAKRLPPPVKRTAGRTIVAETPVYIRSAPIDAGRSRQGLPAAQARPEARQVRNLDRARERAGGGCERPRGGVDEPVGSRWC